MNPIKLSICIPTYNRAALLKEAIESILRQVDAISAGAVEIVVSDNASTDGTEAAVAELVRISKAPIRYFKNERNLGFDTNCLLAVERGTGKYAWLFGSDDLLSTGALGSVLGQIKEPAEFDVLFGEKEGFYLTPDRPMRFQRIMKFPDQKLFNFRQTQTTEKYFRANKKLIAYCNYLSNIIFSREKWLQVSRKEDFVGTGYIHVYIFQTILWGDKPGIMKYLSSPLIKRRWGNDPPVGPAQRLKVDVEMYHRIAEAVFDDRRYVYCIDDMVIRNDGFSWAVRVKLNNPRHFAASTFPFLLRRYWNHPLFWGKIVPLVFLPGFLIRLTRGLYRVLVKGERLNVNEMLEA